MSLVEYYDPDGLFPAVSPLLSNYLPLRNLHWKSPSRPIRSIATLQVDFVPAEINKSANEPHNPKDHRASLTIQGAAESFNKAASVSLEKARRHQIPGLRQTPFLKLFILRCDDNETYKGTSRRLLREWIHDNAITLSLSAATNQQDNHNAFEWLILHVVLPDTVAAAQTRWSKKTSASEDKVLKEKSKSGHWPGKSSNTILEKLRADFNQSSKSAPDRIAQIRLQKSAVPASMLPALPSVGPPATIESQHEQENAWNDLISKLKSLILSSFDLRVSQYEEDVQEKDAQRNLPGWNFCTFFVLKEGLTRAFESVGLTEDALVGYDELSLGLENIICNQFAAKSSNSATSFLSYTPDLLSQLQKFCEVKSQNTESPTYEWSFCRNPLSTSRKDYRQLIVSNDISVFDLKCYIFSRQMHLLLKIARIRNQSNSTSRSSDKLSSNSNREHESSNTGSIHDLSALVELYKRAVLFTSLTSRLMRKDLEAGIKSNLTETAHAMEVAGYMVHVWSFSVIQHILNETYSTELSGRVKDVMLTAQQSSGRKDTISILKASLSVYNHPRALSSTISFDESSLTTVDQNQAPGMQGGVGELATVATYRADLYLSQRTALSTLARGEKIGAIYNRERTTAKKTLGPKSHFTRTLLQDILISQKVYFSDMVYDSLLSCENYSKSFEELTLQAFDLYQFAEKKHILRKLTIDMAIIKFDNGDYVGAASLFNKLISNANQNQWSLIAKSLLLIYSECLKALHRRDEYIKVLLALLGQNAYHKRGQSPALSFTNPASSSFDDQEFFQHSESVFTSLITSAHDLTYEINVPATDFFSTPVLDHSITLSNKTDGFLIGIKFQQFIAESIALDSIRVRLMNISDERGKEIWACSSGEVRLDKSVVHTMLFSNVTTNGHYMVDKIEFKISKIIFSHDFLYKNKHSSIASFQGTVNTDLIRSAKGFQVVCYPRWNSFEIDVTKSKRTANKKRSLTLTVNSGGQTVKSVRLLLRPASAGLRLRITEANIIAGSIDTIQNGEIVLNQLDSLSKASIEVPFDVERKTFQLSLRLEAHYETSEGEFVFLSNPIVRVAEILEIDAQDSFKEDVMVSKYTFRSLSEVPVIVQNVRLEGAEDLQVQTAANEWKPTLSTVQHSPCSIYKFCPRTYFEGAASKQKPALIVTFVSMEEELVRLISDRFERNLRQAPLNSFSGLLIPWLKRKLPSSITKEHYDTISLLGECDIPSFTEICWKSAIDCVPENAKAALESWLRTWHMDNETVSALPTNMDSEKSSAAREDHSEEATVSIRNGDLDFLHVARLELIDRLEYVDCGIATASIGETLEAKLLLSHTWRWSNIAKSPEERASPVEFAYEVLAPPDTWLVGGARSGSFISKEGKTTELRLVLVPLRAGTITLPVVMVRLSQSDTAGKASHGDCETDCISQCQSLIITEGMQSTTVGIGQDQQLAKGMALIESMSKQE